MNKSIWIISLIIFLFLFSYASAQQKQNEPKDAKFYINRGIAYGEKGQFDQAIADFTKAIEIKPNYVISYYRRGYLYYIQKEYDKSWEDIKKAQAIGYIIPPEFLEELRKASGRQN